MDYLELPFNKKLALLREHSFGCEWPNLEQNSGVCIVGKSLAAMLLECGQMEKAGSGLNAARLAAMARPLTGLRFRGGTQPIRLPRSPEKIREPEAGIPQGRVHRSVAKRTRVTTMMCRFEVHVSICCYNYFVGAVACEIAHWNR